MRTTGEGNGQRIELGSFLGNLPELLAGCLAGGRSIAGIAEFDDVRYVQFLVSDNSITAEVISNLFLEEERALTPDQEKMLFEGGWIQPSDEASPNWAQHFEGPEGIFRASRALSDACLRILGKGRGVRPEIVELRTFCVHGSRRVRNRAA